MKVKIITKDIMNLFYEKDGWLYWKERKGMRGKKDSLAGSLDKNNGYYRIGIDKSYYHNHRILYQIYNNVILESTDFIDHIDGNTKNNTKENLRLCTNSQNQMNKKTLKNNLSTGHKNISIQKSNESHYQHYDYYFIQIRKDDKLVFCKTYRMDNYTLEDMIKIRDEQLKIHHGEFYNLG